MSLDRHRREWDELAAYDAFWAVLTRPDKRGGGWGRDEFFATGEEEIAATLAAAEDLGLPRRRLRALDFGCGAGRLTRALATRFAGAVGVDISAQMIETARVLNADVPALELRVNDEPHLRQFRDGEFDFVYTSLVLQHVPGRELIEGYVAELVRVTRADGLLVLGLPDRISLPYRLGVTRRLYGLARLLRVPERTLLRRTPLTPMRMSAVPEDRVRALVAGAGGRVLRAHASQAAGVRNVRYFVAGAGD